MGFRVEKSQSRNALFIILQAKHFDSTRQRIRGEEYAFGKGLEKDDIPDK